MFYKTHRSGNMEYINLRLNNMSDDRDSVYGNQDLTSRDEFSFERGLENAESSVENLTHEQFYELFTKSSLDFVGLELQEKLKDTKFLVAGCGSIGNNIATMAMRSGAENITVADPDKVEEGNLARQEYTIGEVGKNKAMMTALNLRMVNPYISKSIRSIPEGITAENVEELVRNADIIFDGIDIRASDMMYELHKYASIYKKPVIIGYDLAGTAMLAVYRYDKVNMKPLDGEISPETIEQFAMVKQAYRDGRIEEGQFMDYVNHTLSGGIDPLKVPVEQFEQLINKREGETRTPQVGTTARVVSALAIETVKAILSDKEVKKVIAVDLPSEVRKYNPSVLTKVGLMLRTLAVVGERGKKVDTMLSNMSPKL